MHDALRVAYLLNAKICHDMATPINAMNLGIDMASDPDMNYMLRDSLSSANLKLKFYRLLLTPTQTAPDLGEISAFLREFAAEHKVQLTWGPIEADDYSGTRGRILLGLVYLAMESLLRGGETKIQVTDEKVIIQAIGDKCQFRDTYLEAFQSAHMGLDSQNARTIVPYYLKMLAYAEHCKIEVIYVNNESLTFELTAES